MTNDSKQGDNLGESIKKLVRESVSDIISKITKQSMKRTFEGWKDNLDGLSQELVDKLESKLQKDLEDTPAKDCEEGIAESRKLVERAISDSKIGKIDFIRKSFSKVLVYMVVGAIIGGSTIYAMDGGGGTGGCSLPVETVTETSTVTETTTATGLATTEAVTQTVTVTTTPTGPGTIETVTQTQIVTGTSEPPKLPVVLDFEGLPLNMVYYNGETFIESGVAINILRFQWPGETWFYDGSAQVVDTGHAGSSGNEISCDNVNLGFYFGEPLSSLSLNFCWLGGNNNIRINDDFVNFGAFSEINGLMIGGVDISVTNGAKDQPGTLVLSGTISSFSIGGQEFHVDHVSLAW